MGLGVQRLRLAGEDAGPLRRREGWPEPGQDKQKLVEDLRQAMEAATAFCAQHNVALADIETLAAGRVAKPDHDYFGAAGAGGCGLAATGADARREISAFASSRLRLTD